MTFSVVIPCYNCARTLETTVKSVCISGLIDYEILLIDDGSTDGTAELCDSLCAYDPAIRCIHQENAGVSAARNCGIREAQGDYLWFVDADDQIIPLDMNRLSQLLRDQPDCVMFGMDFSYLRHGRQIMRERLSCDTQIVLNECILGDCFASLFQKNYFTTMVNKFVRRDLLITQQIFFDPTLTNYEDLHYSLRLLQVCRKVIALPDVYYNYINDFGHDRTVDRIKKIPDVMAYTDVIVEPFYQLEKQMTASGQGHITGLDEIILRLYMEAAYFKLKTAAPKQFKALCSAVQHNENIRKECSHIAALSHADRWLYTKLMHNAYVRLWLFMQYRRLRSIGSFIYRITKSYIGK